MNTKPPSKPKVDDDYDDGMKAEYDLSKGKRGVFKYCRLPIQIDNEVLGYFPSQGGEAIARCPRRRLAPII